MVCTWRYLFGNWSKKRTSLHIHIHFKAVTTDMNSKSHSIFVLIQDAILNNWYVPVWWNVWLKKSMLEVMNQSSYYFPSIFLYKLLKLLIFKLDFFIEKSKIILLKVIDQIIYFKLDK